MPASLTPQQALIYAMITVSAKDGQKEKMSKSKGNFFMLKDIEKNYDLILVRMWLLSAHYRSPINFSREVMEQTKNGYQRLINGKHNMERLLENAEEHPVSAAEQEILQSVARHRQRFREVMDDDLNTADALTAIYEIIRIANQSLNEQSGKAAVNAVYQIFMELFEVLGLEDRSETVLDEEIERLIAERGEARKNRDFQRADEIRDQLKAKGILLKDTPTGVTWSRE